MYPAKNDIDISKRHVSFLDRGFKIITDDLAIEKSLKAIKTGLYRPKIEHLRSLICEGKDLEYKKLKNRLPAITYSGVFKQYRGIQHLVSYNHLVVLDVDKIEATAVADVKWWLSQCDFIYALWESPSGKGLKGLVEVEYGSEIEDIEHAHRVAFTRIEDYIKTNFGVEIDTSGKDVARLCFVSWDESIYVNNDPHVFEIQNMSSSSARTRSAGSYNTSSSLQNISRKQLNRILYQTTGKNSTQDKRLVIKIVKFLTKRKASITSTYDNWFRVAMALSNHFTYDLAENYYLQLCRLDGDAHDEESSKRILKSCYLSSRKQISIRTLVWFAQKKGFRLKMGGSS